jgi:hypothetical protein
VCAAWCSATSRRGRPGCRGLSVAPSRSTGIQNSPLCFAILVTSFPEALQAKLLELPLLYALFVLLEATVLTFVYRAIDAREQAVPAALDAREPSA